MAEQIRIVLTVDDAVKKMIEDSANEYCNGNTSAYVRGLVVLHYLLQNKDVGADIPGWMLRMYPLRLINRLSENIAEFHKSFAQKEFYERVAPPRSVPNIVRINEMARELKVKAGAIIDLLPGYGVTEKKTHSSSIPADVAEKVRKHLQGQAEAEAQAEAAAKAEKEAKEAAVKAARTK